MNSRASHSLFARFGTVPRIFMDEPFVSRVAAHKMLDGGRFVLEGIASGYWTTFAKCRVVLQPLGFDSLALLGSLDTKVS